MVDDRVDAVEVYIYLLEEPGPEQASCRADQGQPGRDGQSSGKAIPRRHPTTKEEALERISRR